MASDPRDAEIARLTAALAEAEKRAEKAEQAWEKHEVMSAAAAADRRVAWEDRDAAIARAEAVERERNVQTAKADALGEYVDAIRERAEAAEAQVAALRAAAGALVAEVPRVVQPGEDARRGKRGDIAYVCDWCDVDGMHRPSMKHAPTCALARAEALLADPSPAIEALLAARETLARLEAWTHEYGPALCPHGPDTYGDGVRASKAQVASILARRAAVERTKGGGT